LQDKSSAKDKINKAFRLIVCRKPKEQELAILTAYYNDELKTMNSQTATKVLNVGEYPMPENVNKVTLAVMMKVVNTIYNLEEAITKT
jgi:hypothetical protein